MLILKSSSSAAKATCRPARINQRTLTPCQQLGRGNSISCHAASVLAATALFLATPIPDAYASDAGLTTQPVAAACRHTPAPSPALYIPAPLQCPPLVTPTPAPLLPTATELPAQQPSSGTAVLQPEDPAPLDSAVPADPAVAAAAVELLDEPPRGPGRPPSQPSACSIARLRRSPAPFAHVSGRMSLALCGMRTAPGPAPSGA